MIVSVSLRLRPRVPGADRRKRPAQNLHQTWREEMTDVLLGALIGGIIVGLAQISYAIQQVNKTLKENLPYIEKSLREKK